MDEKEQISEQLLSSPNAIDCMENVEMLGDEELEQLFADEGMRHDMEMLAAVNQAVIRYRNPAPDAEKMWERFEERYIVPRQEQRKFRLRVISAALLSAAAVIAVLFLLQKPSNDGQAEDAIAAPLMAFTRDTTPQVIRLCDERGHEQVINEDSYGDNGRMNDLIADFSAESAGSSRKPSGKEKQLFGEGTGWKTIITPRGKVYKVILPDKTQVLMNAESRLSFPDRFTGDERVVRLVGEAFFTVTKDAHHPFIVESEKVRTHVLGTEFNFRAYPNSNPHVTLVSGQVKVDNLISHESVMMKPGQDLTINKKSNFDVVSVDTEYYVQWKEGFFYFDNLPLVEVLKELGRWYNVDIQITDNSLMSYRLHFIADRGASIDQVVENLNGFSYLMVERNGEGIVVSKKTASNK